MDTKLDTAVLREENGERLFPLRNRVTVLGRDPACDIVIKKATTSARHAMIVSSEGAHFLEDLGSVNGTYLNDQQVSQRTRLRTGDKIEIPGLTVRFQDLAPDEANATAEAAPEEAVSVFSSLDPVTDVRPTVKPEAKLRAVLKISSDLGTTLDLNVVLPKILDSLFAIFPTADCGFILLQDASTGAMVQRARKDRRPPRGTPPAYSHSIVQHVAQTRRAILSADAGSDVRFNPTESVRTHHIRSVMCVPMLSDTGTCLGVIQLDSRDLQDQFVQEDLNLMVCAGTLASRAVEMARLHEVQR
jgi:hypothetical protein